VALTLKERPKSTWRHHTNVLARLVANTLTNSNRRPTNRPFTFSSCFIATSKILSIFATKYPVTKAEMRLADCENIAGSLGESGVVNIAMTHPPSLKK
jgi:hypothetical protein